MVSTLKCTVFVLWAAFSCVSFYANSQDSDLPTDLQIRDTIDTWTTLSREQQLVLQDLVLLLKSTLHAEADPSLPQERREQYFLALQHSRYCSRIHLYDTPQGSAWMYKAEQLVLSDRYWQSVLRDFNRKSLGFTRPRPEPAGCF